MPFKTHSTLFLLSFLLIIGFLLLFSRCSLAWDSTASQIYTFDQFSKRQWGHINQALLIQYYYTRVNSSSLYPNYVHTNHIIQQFLLSLSKLNKNIHVQFIHNAHKDYPQFPSFSAANGLKLYSAIQIKYGTKQAKIPLIWTQQQVNSLNFQLLSLFEQLSSRASETIGLVLQDAYLKRTSFQLLQQWLNQRYTSLWLSLGRSIDPQKIPLLVLIGSLDSLSWMQIYHLQQYLNGGGKLLWLASVNGVDHNDQLHKGVSPIFARTFLKYYGIDIAPGILINQSHGVPFKITSPQGVQSTHYPGWFFIPQTPASLSWWAHRCRDLMALWASGMSISSKGKQASFQVSPLLRAPGFSQIVHENISLIPDSLEKWAQQDKNYISDPMLLALSVQTFHSQWKGFFQQEKQKWLQQNHQLSLAPQKPLKFIFIADSYFVSDLLEQTGYTANFDFFQQCLLWLKGDYGLLNLKNKVLLNSQFNTIGQQKAKQAQFWMIVVEAIFIPLLVLLIGVRTWKKNKSRRK